MKLDDLRVDFMPDDDSLGFSNRWYKDAMATSTPYDLDQETTIQLVSPVYFVATKLEAWRGRGRGDPLVSQDIEDILNLIDGRPELHDEIQSASEEVRNYIRHEIGQLLSHPDIEYAVDSQSGGDTDRANLLLNGWKPSRRGVSLMQISWISCQGKERGSNNDAAAIGRKDHYVLAMLVDAAEKGNGQELARHWARTIITAALETTQQLDPANLISIMRTEQQQLRHGHLHAIASYCCVLVDLRQELLHIVHIGDCLVGTQRHGEAINWLIRPHNAQEQGIWPKAPLPPQESRHLLTRS